MGNTMQNQYTEWARQVLSTEAEALQEVSRGLDEAFVQAVEAILHCHGRVVVMGIGKSGHIGRKIAATMAPPARRLFSCIRPKPPTVIWA